MNPIWIAAFVLGLAAMSAARADATAETTAQQEDPFGVLEEQAEEELFLLFDEQKQVEKVVSGATLKKQSVDEAPSLVVVLSDDFFRRYHLRTLGEALNYLVGVDVITDHVYTDVGVRGIFGDMNANGSALKVIVDGMDTAFRTTGFNAFAYEQVPVESILRVEVIRGPMSVVYGANAFLGVINVITKANTGKGVRAWARGQTFARYPQGTVGALGEYKGKKFFVGGTAQYTYADKGGLSVPPASSVLSDPRWQGGALTTVHDVQRYVVAGAHAGWLPLEGLEVRADAVMRWLDASGQFQPASLLLPQNRIATAAGFTQLQVTYRYKWLGAELKGWGNIGRDLPQARQDMGLADLLFRRNLGFREIGGSLRLTFDPTKWLSGWLRAEYSSDVERMNEMFVVPRAGGAEQRINAATNPAQPLPGWAEALNRIDIPAIGNFGTSAHATVNPLPALGLSVGGRWDHHTVYGDNFSYRAGAVGQLEGVGYVKLLSGRAFKAPTPQQLFWLPMGNADFEGNPQLKPQSAMTHELVVGRRDLGGFDLQATGFITTIDNRALYIARNGRFQAQGISSSFSAGAEAEVHLPKMTFLSEKLLLTAQLSLGYQHTQLSLSSVLNTLLTTRNVLFPDFKASALASLDVNPIYVGFMARVYATSQRLDSQVNIQVRGGEVTVIPPSSQLDLGVQTTNLEHLASWLAGFKAQLTVRNVLGDATPYPGYNGFQIPREPRSFDLYLSWQY